MRRISLLALGLAIAGPAIAAWAAKPTAETTHQQVKDIVVKGQEAGNALQTLCLDGDGNVVALVAPGRYGTKPKTPVSEVQVFSPAGDLVRQWKVNFLAQSINGGPGGSVLVAGDGRLAKFDKDGKPVSEVELPQVVALLKDSAKLRQKAKEQLEQEIQSYEQMAKQFKDQQERLKKKDADDRLNANEKAQLRALEQNVRVYEQIAEQSKQKTLDQVVAAMTSSLRTINAVAATEKDVYVVTGATKGHGYAVWRMDPELKAAEEIIPSVMGCCGQMDIQARGDDLFVAENCSHAVGKYTRDGKKVTSFGKRGQNLEPECFGGCCNPMNCRIATDGSVYTAESEGHVKLFNAKGEFVACVGTASLKGGCKNVAVAVSPDGERVYFCDQPGSRILVLAKKSAKVE
ncbi:MAG TPA: hypothetical protein VH120_02250 [Gemmataceae bacterium]|jgi:sugar lactone lactonase YvrE|nr:hypothetical protein [Gemmataceae bacterium]